MIYRFFESVANWIWEVLFDNIGNLLKLAIAFFIFLFLAIMLFNAAPVFNILGTFIGSHFLGFTQYQSGVIFSMSLLVGFYVLFTALTFFMALNADNKNVRLKRAVRIASVIVGLFALGINMYSMYSKDKSALKTESRLADVVDGKGEFIGIDTINNVSTAKAIDDRKSAEAGLAAMLLEINRQQTDLGELRKRLTWYKAGSNEYKQHAKIVSQAQEELDDMKKNYSEQIGYVKELRDAERQTIHNSAIRSERLREVHEDTLDELTILGMMKGLFVELGFVGFAYLYIIVAGLSGFNLDSSNSKPNLIQTKPAQAPKVSIGNPFTSLSSMFKGVRNKITPEKAEPVHELKPELVRESVRTASNDPAVDNKSVNSKLLAWFSSQFKQVANPELKVYKMAGVEYTNQADLFRAMAQKANSTKQFSIDIDYDRIKNIYYRNRDKFQKHDSATV